MVKLRLWVNLRLKLSKALNYHRSKEETGAEADIRPRLKLK